MTREIVARHDPVVLTSPHVGAALAVHRAIPALSLVELLEQAARSGPVNRAVEHAYTCRDCRVGTLCAVGARLAQAIGRRGSRLRRAT
jgi:hypothetical protein